VISSVAAAKAYAAVQKIAADPVPPDASSQASGPSFAQLVNNVIGQAVQSSRHAETEMAAQAKGKAELLDVVTAVSSAETSLQTVMAVRDQVIAAYQQIMSMQI
jgi:flagellar hook-basal body complex protein FliE